MPAKLINIAKLKTVLLTIWNDLPWSSSTRQSYNFTADFNHRLLQLVDILNALFNTGILSGHPTFITEAFELLMKSCAELTRYL